MILPERVFNYVRVVLWTCRDGYGLALKVGYAVETVIGLFVDEKEKVMLLPVVPGA